VRVYLAVLADALEQSLQMLHGGHPDLEHRAPVAAQLVDLGNLRQIRSGGGLQRAAVQRAAHLDEQRQTCLGRRDPRLIPGGNAGLFQPPDPFGDGGEGEVDPR
jgi:hypothetical protein